MESSPKKTSDDEFDPFAPPPHPSLDHVILTVNREEGSVSVNPTDSVGVAFLNSEIEKLKPQFEQLIYKSLTKFTEDHIVFILDQAFIEWEARGEQDPLSKM